MLLYTSVTYVRESNPAIQSLCRFAALPVGLWIRKPVNAVFQSTTCITAVYCIHIYILQPPLCLAGKSWHGKDEKCWWAQRCLGMAVNLLLPKSIVFLVGSVKTVFVMIWTSLKDTAPKCLCISELLDWGEMRNTWGSIDSWGKAQALQFHPEYCSQPV